MIDINAISAVGAGALLKGLPSTFSAGSNEAPGLGATGVQMQVQCTPVAQENFLFRPFSAGGRPYRSTGNVSLLQSCAGPFVGGRLPHAVLWYLGLSSFRMSLLAEGLI